MGNNSTTQTLSTKEITKQTYTKFHRNRREVTWFRVLVTTISDHEHSEYAIYHALALLRDDNSALYICERNPDGVRFEPVTPADEKQYSSETLFAQCGVEYECSLLQQNAGNNLIECVQCEVPHKYDRMTRNSVTFVEKLIEAVTTTAYRLDNILAPAEKHFEDLRVWKETELPNLSAEPGYEHERDSDEEKREMDDDEDVPDPIDYQFKSGSIDRQDIELLSNQLNDEVKREFWNWICLQVNLSEEHARRLMDNGWDMRTIAHLTRDDMIAAGITQKPKQILLEQNIQLYISQHSDGGPVGTGAPGCEREGSLAEQDDAYGNNRVQVPVKPYVQPKINLQISHDCDHGDVEGGAEVQTGDLSW